MCWRQVSLRRRWEGCLEAAMCHSAGVPMEASQDVCAGLQARWWSRWEGCLQDAMCRSAAAQQGSQLRSVLAAGQLVEALGGAAGRPGTCWCPYSPSSALRGAWPAAAALRRSGAATVCPGRLRQAQCAMPLARCSCLWHLDRCPSRRWRSVWWLTANVHAMDGRWHPYDTAP